MTSKSPAQIQRALRLYLIDLQLSEDPHADIIAQAYARLVELEHLVGSQSHPTMSPRYEQAVLGMFQEIQGGQS